jgi:hypothetical protein
MAILSRGAFGQVSPDPSTHTVRISGRVMDSGGGPIPHATVNLRVTGVDESTATTETDENGSFTFPAAVPQHYELFFAAQGFSRLTFRVRAPNNSTDINVGIVVLEVAPIESPSDVPYDLAPVQESLNEQATAKVPGSRETLPAPVTQDEFSGVGRDYVPEGRQRAVLGQLQEDGFFRNLRACGNVHFEALSHAWLSERSGLRPPSESSRHSRYC